MRRIILAISGASGMPLAATLLRALATLPDIEIHLIVSQGASLVLRHEHAGHSAHNQDCHSQDLFKAFALAHVEHDSMDFAAGPASGSWRHDGMIICPCSMSSLASIAHGIGTNLIHRAADVTLKERRPLVLVTRETPLSRIHLKNMLTAAEAGAIIMPPCPAFYTNPSSVQDILENTAGRILDQIGLEHNLGRRWCGG